MLSPKWFESRSPPVIERTSRVAPHDRCKLALSRCQLGRLMQGVPESDLLTWRESDRLFIGRFDFPARLCQRHDLNVIAHADAPKSAAG